MYTLHRRDTMQRIRCAVVACFERCRLMRGRIEWEAVRELRRGAEVEGLEVLGLGVLVAYVDCAYKAFVAILSLCTNTGTGIIVSVKIE